MIFQFSKISSWLSDFSPIRYVFSFILEMTVSSVVVMFEIESE